MRAGGRRRARPKVRREGLLHGIQSRFRHRQRERGAEGEVAEGSPGSLLEYVNVPHREAALDGGRAPRRHHARARGQERLERSRVQARQTVEEAVQGHGRRGVRQEAMGRAGGID